MTVVIRFQPGLKPTLKHAQHDQSTHGSWAMNTKKDLAIQANQFDSFEEFSRAVSLEGLRPRAWHITDKDNFNPSKDVRPMSRTGESSQESILFVGDPATWQDYASGRKIAVEYDLTNLEFNIDFASDKSGNQGFYIKENAYSKLKKVGEFSVEQAISRASKQQNQMPQSKDEALSIWQSIEKHAMHDQSTHGSWAKGPNRLYTTEILRLHKNTDSQASKVYKAEQEDFDKRTDSSLVEPKLDNNPANYPSREAYTKAFKDYSKAWDEWALKRHSDVRSERGQKLLNGTKKGVEKYVDEVLNSTWFLENFGDGGPIGQPKITTTTQQGVAAKWQIGYKLSPRTGETYVNQIAVKKRYMKNEPTILHEIAHFATAISQTERFESHGKEFAGNHIRIVTEFLGPQEGATLRESYTQGGVEFD